MGVVVVGRNEAGHLDTCLRSVAEASPHWLYVDSGSTDGSVETARAAGAPVLELDPARPFSAARARNEGFAQLTRDQPELLFVQFLDGDCEIEPGWLAAAESALSREPGMAIVCGRLRERHPEASAYQRMCDMEWDAPPGDVEESGGIFAVRATDFREAGGFEATLVAGEEPDLCLRLRARSRGIVRIATPMAVHDAEMTRFGPWWTRSLRCGWADAALATRHGRKAHRAVRAMISSALWGGALPAAVVVLAGPAPVLALGLVGAVGVQWLRIARGRRRAGRSRVDARVYATLTLLGKLPHGLGALRFAADRLLGRSPKLIE